MKLLAAIVAAVAALAIVGALVAAFPQAMGRLIKRAVVPSAEVDNIYASSLSVPSATFVSPISQLAVSSGLSSGLMEQATVS